MRTDPSVRSAASRSARTGAGVLAGGLALLVTASAGAAPAPISPPTIQGQVRFNETLTCQPGRWTGAPASFRYEWLRSGSPFAEGQVLRFTDIYTMGGYLLSCHRHGHRHRHRRGRCLGVRRHRCPAAGPRADHANDHQGAGTASGEGAHQGPGRPALLTRSPFGKTDYVVPQLKVAGGVTRLSDLVSVNAAGRFTVTGTDTPGRKRIIVRYWSGERDIWGGTEVTRTVRVTKGGTPGSGGVVGIGG
jgi:hypothetical protein